MRTWLVSASQMGSSGADCLLEKSHIRWKWPSPFTNTLLHLGPGPLLEECIFDLQAGGCLQVLYALKEKNTLETIVKLEIFIRNTQWKSVWGNLEPQAEDRSPSCSLLFN